MFCARCGEEITVPVWINNLPYGYTCAEIVRPGNKKPKEKYFDVTANIIKVAYDNACGTRIVITAIDNRGKKLILQ